eukprot:TRINITY_DN13238_c0_g1_i2.p1 TRINITY_DN13238_c0_g1~~TRINITY_DN13238_c0_g1_i2.p1  ORF type:complete len:182 (-),score=25.38 TRINITY_DN13238_c0_g1_i2:163-708(-)
MQNILSGSESPLSAVHSLSSSDNKLTPFCQWIVQRHAEQIPPLCFQLRNMTHHHGAREPETSYVSHRHNSPYGEAIEHSFATGSGVIGTLGCVLLILVLIAVLSCFKEHRRIKFLPTGILSNTQLANLQTTVNIDSSAESTAPDENPTSQTEDPLPDYNTVINITKNEENPPDYHEAIGLR